MKRKLNMSSLYQITVEFEYEEDMIGKRKFVMWGCCIPMLSSQMQEYLENEYAEVEDMRIVDIHEIEGEYIDLDEYFEIQNKIEMPEDKGSKYLQ